MSLVDDLLAGDQRALARVITRIEDRVPGYRETVAELHRHAGGAHVVGVTGPPGAGKSTLVDRVAAAYRERGQTVGVIAVDPASPFTGGAVLGDRIRMGANAGDPGVFVRSMSARGTLGGLSTATTDAVTALDAFGKDVVIVETVGAGQNEVEVVRAADTVAVLVPPASGDDVQMLKAGVLEIADLFVVNKADLDGADQTVRQLREMLHERTNRGRRGDGSADDPDDGWDPPIVETTANTGAGVDDVLDAVADHLDWLESSGRREAQVRERYAAAVRTLLREDARDLLAEELAARGGLEEYVDRIAARETDPYAVAEEVLAPLRECIRERGERDEKE
ncbi:methylmalonyl Co-A mutase-associated GTPase MeaB [Halomicrobium salinisoli]|uniref:methylmalonyl Co-A mutase-associated GTPase MeaB n=1 Tax=Halomicrobium salinisoli TaxID=2878391 RepID=UPI001CF03386|nr:methylmalonyl Co-A mutase-associated GTPase MeaB [Halomicrobium salinisoli]